MPPTRRSEIEMYEKGFARPMFTSRTSTSRPLSQATEIYDTEFEEDSDFDDYVGRRSEDSVSTGFWGIHLTGADVLPVREAKHNHSIDLRRNKNTSIP